MCKVFVRELYTLPVRSRVEMLQMQGNLVKSWSSLVDSKTHTDIRLFVTLSCTGQQKKFGFF